MDLNFTPEDEAFRKEVRGFIEQNFPQELRNRKPGRDLSRDEFMKWHKILAKKGWVAPAWPKEWGGTDWTPTQRYIWDEENARADTTPLIPFGLKMVGPVIYTFASDKQKKKFLPRIYNGEDWWCQGYSEAGAGSDLASLRLKAAHDGDTYTVNGAKTWTTYAQYADWIFCLVRTASGPKPQEGISFLLIDMKSPGITVRPIITLDGGHEINEVFFENVEVPADNLVGEENKGWTYAKFLLAHERTSIAGVARSKRALDRLKDIAATEQSDGEPLSIQPEFSRKLAELEIDLTALEMTELRTLASESEGKGPGPESSILKIKGTEIQQRLTELTMEAVGHYAAPYDRAIGDNLGPIGPEYAEAAGSIYFNTRKTSIYGGSNEIQRNIIAKMVLGL